MTDRIMNAEQRIKPMPTSPWTPWLPIHVPSETLLGRFMEGMTKQGSDAPVVSLRYPDESVIEYRLPLEPDRANPQRDEAQTSRQGNEV